MTKTYPEVLMSPMFFSVRKKIRNKRFFRSLEGTVPLIKKKIVTWSQNYSFIKQDPLLIIMPSGGGRLFLRKHFP